MRAVFLLFLPIAACERIETVTSLPGAASETPAPGKPKPECSGGDMFCGGACVDPRTDENHCGECDNACVSPDHGTATCRRSACRVQCEKGWLPCDGGCCVDPGTLPFCVGRAFGCATNAQGVLLCFGAGAEGQLGSGNFQTSLDPQRVAFGGTRTVHRLACGMDSAFADTDQGPFVWGRNTNGELGLGTQTPGFHGRAVSAPLLRGAIFVGFGEGFGCALLQDETVSCFGRNGEGQLGDGTLTDRLRPGGVRGIAPVVTLGVGSGHACALSRDGRVHCWGSNEQGRIRDLTGPYSAYPVRIDLDAVEGLFVGEGDTCVLEKDGGAHCWGAKNFGRLLFPSPVQSISLGLAHGCALLENHTVHCWGDNGSGAVGPSAGTRASRPVQVFGLSEDVVSLGVGAYHSCAKLSGGEVDCWGAFSEVSPTVPPTRVEKFP